MEMRETTTATYCFYDLIVSKSFGPIFDLLHNVTDPNRHFRPGGMKIIVLEKPGPGKL